MISFNRVKEGWVNSNCKCDPNYSVWNGACLATCNGNNEFRNALGACEACEGTVSYPSVPTGVSVEAYECGE